MRRPLLLIWALALCYSCSLLACAQAPSAAAALPQIQTITLERDCFGCSAGSRLQLQSDGQVSFTLTGKARHGTVDQISQGRLAAGDFERLCRLLQAQGFFELPERIEDGDTQDGAWTLISVSGPSLDKQVWRRSEKVPAALQEIEAALDALKAELALQPPSR
ncbi:hypothetical protein DBR47_10840 [Paucibacter sp. KBW04]|uniref:hypothetical protein n=1 Tax=Paucibacter sp. KBW04 TaxID=2153361 RepID=UPI000F573813|nr:hypothetical protein [Paucibacter sp. KBW04]RQO59859.1 hypothetical protein DBR47_10840 [Paucibacter sp. KBW04]